MKKILTTLVAVALAQSVYSINTSQLERTTYQSISLTELSTNNGLQDNAKATKRVNETDGWSEKSKKSNSGNTCNVYICPPDSKGNECEYKEVCGGTYEGKDCAWLKNCSC